MSSNSVEPRPIDRRKVVTAIAWAAPTIVVAGAAPAFAASVQPGNYAALFDAQGADTNQQNTDATTWPHGLLTDSGGFKFQLGMEMMMYNQPAYNVAPQETVQELDQRANHRPANVRQHRLSTAGRSSYVG